MKFTKATLMTVFAVSIAIANVTAAKIAWFTFPYIGGVAIPAGFVAIGVSFLCTDLLSELYGREAARATVNGTVVALMVAFALVYVAILMPVAPFYGLSDEYDAVLGGGATIVIAAILTTLVSQNIDVSVFHRVKEVTDRKWARNLSSTAASQFVDTTLFIGLAFVLLPLFLTGSSVTLGVAVSMVVGQYVVKLVVAGLDTPLFYLLSR